MQNFELNPTQELTQNGEEKKELSNRQQQFNRLTNASEAARKIKEELINQAPSQEAALFLNNRPLNFFILNFIYKKEGITDFKKFNEWKQEGATVRKGEKAFPIWGQPIGKQKEDEAQSKGEEYTANELENRHYPICYVFSNLQVRATAERGAEC